MKGMAIIFLLCWMHVQAQKVQTIVPTQSVVSGAAFQVQFVVTGANEIHVIADPSFEGLRRVSGPNYYSGNVVMDGKPQHVENITYTLVPERAGKFVVKG